MLKALLDNLDGLSDEVKAFYKPGEGDLNGKFILNVEPAAGLSLENVEGLKSALGRTKGELEEAKAAVEGFKGLNARTVREKLAKLEKLEKIDPETEAGRLAEEKITARLDEATKGHQIELQKRETRETQLTEALQRTLITEQAKAAILAAKGAPKLLLAGVTGRLKMEEVDGTFKVKVLDEDGKQLFEVKDGNAVPASIDYLVSRFKADPDYGRAFEGSGVSGSGTSGGGAAVDGSTKNPWAKDSFNLTEQMKLLKSNPTMAAALKARAGV